MSDPELTGASILQARRDRMVIRVREALRRRVRASTHTQRDVERRNGFRPGYLSQVLQGHIALTLRHLLGILLALEVDPETFFAELAGRYPSTGGDWIEIRQRMKRYDAALDQLTRKGLIDGGADDREPETG